MIWAERFSMASGNVSELVARANRRSKADWMICMLRVREHLMVHGKSLAPPFILLKGVDQVGIAVRFP